MKLNKSIPELTGTIAQKSTEEAAGKRPAAFVTLTGRIVQKFREYPPYGIIYKVHE
ncbi:hypothetical protein [Paenibacillus sp. GCM10027629]|uniref:hypothetical protein n=1 Tax=Paenibacillus sp. GCM10027629 TaxID=3273414 RepID=UPI0036D2EAA4